MPWAMAGTVEVRDSDEKTASSSTVLPPGERYESASPVETTKPATTSSSPSEDADDNERADVPVGSIVLVAVVAVGGLVEVAGATMVLEGAVVVRRRRRLRARTAARERRVLQPFTAALKRAVLAVAATPPGPLHDELVEVLDEMCAQLEHRHDELIEAHGSLPELYQSELRRHAELADAIVAAAADSAWVDDERRRRGRLERLDAVRAARAELDELAAVAASTPWRAEHASTTAERLEPPPESV